MDLPRVLINISASPLAFDHNGVILWCLNPKCSANCLNSKLWNGPLSVFSSSGIPNTEKILSNRGITDLADDNRSSSTTGYLEWSYITTNRYSPVRNGPQKSAETRYHGSSVILSSVVVHAGFFLILAGWFQETILCLIIVALSLLFLADPCVQVLQLSYMYVGSLSSLPDFLYPAGTPL